MELEFPRDEYSTPLEDEELDGISIPGITHRNQLNEHEQQNIEEAHQWLIGRQFKAHDIPKESFIQRMHKRMFGRVWKWAGKFRITNKNLGVEWTTIPIELRKLLDDVKYWIEHETFGPEEIAIRFKHRLVSIHCFSNGNGRHSRLMADIIMEKIYGRPVFTWGLKNLVTDGNPRKTYIVALRAADKGNYGPLLQFAQS